ncbi:MAG: polysaccharide deacetylase family protein [Lentisphaeria bacterium]|nr:polysaccharide deacetylase family protein [Lentisphaeria bacterium]
MKLTPLYPDGKIKALTFSYDDGSRDDIRLVEIFNRFGMKATFNLIGSQFNNESRVHADEAKTLYAGHEIASHSYTHPFLDRIPKACALNEMLQDRRELEKLTGSIVNGFALPYGTWNAETVELLRSAGYLYSRTTQATMNFKMPQNFLEWHPTCHHRNAPELAEAFKKTGYALTLFYVWGHSYEFPRNNNWELIENFCSELAGLPDVWYATNGEIVRYVNALRRLETSVDAEIIRNPSAISLWFRNSSGEAFELKPGETRRLN